VVENARKLIDAVKPKRARFSYEVMGWPCPDGPTPNLELIQGVDREGFGRASGSVQNAVNSPARFYRNTDLLTSFFTS